MTTLEDPHAILIIGPYGSGKSSLAGEIADVLEGQLPYAAIDMDWLAWFDTGDSDERVVIANTAPLREVAQTVIQRVLSPSA